MQSRGQEIRTCLPLASDRFFFFYSRHEHVLKKESSRQGQQTAIGQIKQIGSNEMELLCRRDWRITRTRLPNGNPP